MVDKHSNNLIIGINIVDFSSSGNIMLNSLRYAHDNGDFDYYVIVPKSHYESTINTYSFAKKKMNIVQRIIFNRLIKERKRYPPGFCGYVYTKRIIKRIKTLINNYENVIVHLHTIHTETISMPMLFKFLKKTKHIKHVFITMHDMWYLTGGCAFTQWRNCFEWKKGNNKCKNCTNSNNKTIKKSIIKKDANYYLKEKQKCLNQIKDNVTIIAVSNWLNNIIKESNIFNLPSIVNYGETSLKPYTGSTIFLKKQLGVLDKKIVLTVSYYWHPVKGTQYIYKIADKLPEDYVYIIVGPIIDTNGRTNILCTGEIESEHLNAYYSMADIYVSVSQSESLGLTTCEAQICGIPVVAFGHTAIKETFIDGKTGILVGEDNNIDNMVNAIIHIVKHHPFKKEDIINNGLRFAKNEHAKRMLIEYNKYKL